MTLLVNYYTLNNPFGPRSGSYSFRMYDLQYSLIRITRDPLWFLSIRTVLFYVYVLFDSPNLTGRLCLEMTAREKQNGLQVIWIRLYDASWYRFQKCKQFSNLNKYKYLFSFWRIWNKRESKMGMILKQKKKYLLHQPKRPLKIFCLLFHRNHLKMAVNMNVNMTLFDPKFELWF